MSNLRDRVNDAISTHPDAVVLAFACVVLFLVVANFLWARRASRLEKAIEELAASRQSLTHLLQRPEHGADDDAGSKPRGQRYSVVEPGPRSQREATLGAALGTKPAAEAITTPTTPATPPTATEVAAPQRIEEPATVVEAGDTTVRLATAEIPASWRAAEEDVTPPAAAWAVGAEQGAKPPAASPFKTMSFEPLGREDAGSTAQAAEAPTGPAPTPAQKPDPAAWSRPTETVGGTTTPAFSFPRDAKAAGAPTSASWAAPAPSSSEPPPPAQAAPSEARPTAADITAAAAYSAWSEVTGSGRPSDVPAPPAPIVVAPAEPLAVAGNGNGRVHADGDADDNGGHAHDAQLEELTPVAAQTVQTPAVEGDAPAPAGPNGGILIVEDDDNVAKIYRIVLESKGHNVRHAADGVAALEEVRRGRPDLILLDVMMPRMNGILFLQSLRAQSDLREVPVVILSNFREPRLVNRAMALGALEYVVKAQTKPEAIVNAVPRWMAGERAFSA